MTSDGIEIMREFGLDQALLISKRVKVLRKSCFESCNQLHEINFEIGPELARIGPAVFRDGLSLVSIEFSVPVKNLDECSLEGCDELEFFVLDRNSSESLRRVLGDRSLDDALSEFGVTLCSNLFRVEVDDGGVVKKFHTYH
jgi:hypothetical protein